MNVETWLVKRADLLTIAQSVRAWMVRYPARPEWLAAYPQLNKHA